MTKEINKSLKKDCSIPNVSSQDYRDAMSKFGAAVHLLTTDGKSGKRGVTISACCSLSDEPPTILACVRRQSEENQLFIDNGRFCVNTLSGHHQELSNIFAGRGKLSQKERFHKAEWTTLITSAPVLSDAPLSLDCQLVSWHVHATHFVLIGEVVALQKHASKNVLLYLERDYKTLPLND
ncbi:flavin reductase [Bartonella tamiae]|uniref:Flavin reductase like domain-containing protein n=1 Tax=Bartonella tamiae Th239 TaxID=1094558 RepID=J1JUY7_9HYPH|nr:flavin reductase [Bartonella tamiae]EJF88787.1 hypothetical protein ME5_01338 [Bartonella tamiae Th239]EJF94963.1 hypothetical protein MEG_00544 [Bartonella tamiae Th307]